MLAPFHGAEAIGEGDGAAKVVIVRIGPAAGLTGSAQHDFTAEAHIVGVDALRHIVPEDHRAGAVIEGVNRLAVNSLAHALKIPSQTNTPLADPFIRTGWSCMLQAVENLPVALRAPVRSGSQ